ncbi:MAG TPA: hypothetical protein VKB93_12825 [Thermoanaerobaculia bacterium]|nr:hypothetical protein [Thermoanaerobaculia bacterium]
MRRTLPLLLLLLTTACATTGTIVGNTGGASTEGSTDDFGVTIVQANAASVMRGQSSAEVRFDITIANRTQEPYTIKRIVLQSMSVGGFVVPLRTRTFDKTIAAGAKGQLPFWATAQVSDTGTPRHPVTLRASVDAVSASGEERSETFTAQINGRLHMQIAKRSSDPFTTPDFMQQQQWIPNVEYNTIVYSAYGLTW